MRKEDEEQKRINEIHRDMSKGAMRLGLDASDYSDYGEAESKVKGLNVGACSNCTNFYYARSAFAVRVMYCNEFKILLSEAEPIMDCNLFDEMGKLSLRDMASMAIIIDADKKEAAGFRSTSTKEVVKDEDKDEDSEQGQERDGHTDGAGI